MDADSSMLSGPGLSALLLSGVALQASSKADGPTTGGDPTAAVVRLFGSDACIL